MRTRHGTFLFATLMFGLGIAAQACTVQETDTNTPVNTGGSAGAGNSSGSGGSSGAGTGGASGTGGTAGASGTGGTAGDSGAGGGGAAGSSGAGGDAGTAGLGGAAGSSGVGGAAGSSGVGGAAGSSGVGGGGAGGSSGGPSSTLRFAHLAPDVPAIDVCFRQEGSATWSGPIFHLSEADQEFFYPGMSTQLAEAPPGSYLIRAVAAGSTTCDTAFLPSFADQTFIVGSGNVYTLALLGEQANALTWGAYIDPPVVTAAGKVSLEAINAMTKAAGAVDFGLLKVTRGQQDVYFDLPGRNNLPFALNGYQEIDLPNFDHRVGVVNTGTNEVLAVNPIAVEDPAVSDVLTGESYGSDRVLFIASGTNAADPTVLARPQIIICPVFAQADEPLLEGTKTQLFCVYAPPQ